MESWQSHVESRGNPALEGAWGDIPWEFYEHNQVVPDALVRTAMCVPVRLLNPIDPQVMLTLNQKRSGWEIPGGHLDRLADSIMETPAQAAARETEEETGLRVASGRLVPYGYVEVRNNSAGDYPPRSCMQFFGVYAPGEPGRPTDPAVDGADTLAITELREKVVLGEMKATELALVCFGVRTVLRHHGLPYEHLTLP